MPGEVVEHLEESNQFWQGLPRSGGNYLQNRYPLRYPDTKRTLSGSG